MIVKLRGWSLKVVVIWSWIFINKRVFGCGFLEVCWVVIDVIMKVMMC